MGVHATTYLRLTRVTLVATATYHVCYPLAQLSYLGHSLVRDQNTLQVCLVWENVTRRITNNQDIWHFVTTLINNIKRRERDHVKRQEETSSFSPGLSCTLSLFTGLLLPLDTISFLPSLNSTFSLFSDLLLPLDTISF